MHQQKWLLKYPMHCIYKCMIPIIFTVHVLIIPIFCRHFLYKFGTISGTKYSSHWSISCIGVIGILEVYKTWQVSWNKFPAILFPLVERTYCISFYDLYRELDVNSVLSRCTIFNPSCTAVLSHVRTVGEFTHRRNELSKCSDTAPGYSECVRRNWSFLSFLNDWLMFPRNEF